MNLNRVNVVVHWWMLNNFVAALIEPIAFIAEKLGLKEVPKKKP